MNVLSSLADRWFDVRRRVDTRGRFVVDAPYSYDATGVREFRGLLRQLPSEIVRGSFVDYGCGKGRTLLLAEEFGFRSVEGVEIDDTLAATARVNGVRVHSGDARDYAPPSDLSLMFFFNPFDASVMRTVLDRALSVAEIPFHLVYHNNTTTALLAEYAGVIDPLPDVVAGKSAFGVYRADPAVTPRPARREDTGTPEPRT